MMNIKFNYNLGPKIKVANNLIEKELNNQIRKIFDNYHLTGPQVALLIYLFEHQENNVSQKELEIKFTISHPTIRSIVKRLVEQNLIVTTVAKKDKRQIILSLSETGRKIIEKNLNQIYQTMNLVDRKITNNLSNEEQKSLLNILNQIISNFRK